MRSHKTRLARRLQAFPAAPAQSAKWRQICPRRSNKFPFANSRPAQRASLPANHGGQPQGVTGSSEPSRIWPRAACSCLTALLRLRQMCCDLRLLSCAMELLPKPRPGKLDSVRRVTGGNYRWRPSGPRLQPVRHHAQAIKERLDRGSIAYCVSGRFNHRPRRSRSSSFKPMLLFRFS